MKIEQRLKELGFELPGQSAPVGNYVNFVQTGNLLYLAGKGPFSPGGGPAPSGKVGAEVSLEDAYLHARSIGLAQIAAMKDALGDLDRVNRIVKVLGMVNAAPDFRDHPTVINGCSDLFADVSARRDGTPVRRSVSDRCR